MNWKALQNGSDIRGVALEGVAGEEVNLTEQVVGRIGGAFLSWLARRTGKPEGDLAVAVGMDSRLSGPALKKALGTAWTNRGARVGDAGLASTPAMFMSTVLPGFLFDGAVMLTASHLPFNRNGMKFFTRDGGLDKPDITEILAAAEQNQSKSATQAPHGAAQSVDLMEAYAAGIVARVREGVRNVENVERPLEGLHIIVDAGNGAGGFFADKVLQPLGADTRGSQFLEPDGRFPNHEPNPENAEAMNALVDAVRSRQADFGIIFDTDVDRAAAVDRGGILLHRNRLIGVLAAILLEEHPGTTIVTDSITSSGLTTFIEEQRGGRHHRFKRGYRNVINEAVRLNEAGQDTQLAVETSGHAAFKENYFLDDGCYVVTRLLIKLAMMKRAGEGTLSDLIADLPEPAERAEFRIGIKATDFKAEGEAVLDALRDFVAEADGWSVAPRNFEGVRVDCDRGAGHGWFLLRLSLHDPVLPLNVESEETGGVRLIAERLLTFLRAWPRLDVTALEQSLD
jgi:phosphomannomutase